MDNSFTVNQIGVICTDTFGFRLVKELAEKENITEKLKADNQMQWVQRMNSLKNRVTEMVNNELSLKQCPVCAYAAHTGHLYFQTEKHENPTLSRKH